MAEEITWWNRRNSCRDIWCKLCLLEMWNHCFQYWTLSFTWNQMYLWV